VEIGEERHRASLVSPAKMTHKVHVEEDQSRPAFLDRDHLDTVSGNETLTAAQLKLGKKILSMGIVKPVAGDNNSVGRLELMPWSAAWGHLMGKGTKETSHSAAENAGRLQSYMMLVDQP